MSWLTGNKVDSDPIYTHFERQLSDSLNNLLSPARVTIREQLFRDLTQYADDEGMLRKYYGL